MRLLVATIAGLLLALAGVACGGDASATPANSGPQATPVAFPLTSEAFKDGADIPARFTCDGDNASPQLTWSDLPLDTKSLALIADDPDAPSGTFNHWVLFNLPSYSKGLTDDVPKTDKLDSGALQGRNSFGQIGYSGPCPPFGSVHHYHFQLYALDSNLDLKAGATKAQVLAKMEGHVVGRAELIGLFKR